MTPFETFAARKAREAATAHVCRLETTQDHSSAWPMLAVGNDWTRAHYDGPFHVFGPPADLPAISLVFVQSREGNTGVPNPADLGGGATDLHLIYEGLSRVAADAVLSGATTASGRDNFFSIWHPELVALRASLGLPRHPGQVIVSKDGRIDLDRTLLFNVPDVPVFLLAGDICRTRSAEQLARRPWITLVPLGAEGIAPALALLRAEHGIRRISAIGGRTTATRLIDASLVQDVCLTTTSRNAGEPNTPFYAGRHPPRLERIVAKREMKTIEPIRFEQFALPRSR